MQLAERKTKGDKVTNLIPVCAQPASAAFADLPDKDKVRMLFPRGTVLQIDHNQKVFFAAGVRAVPKSLADHWWLAANGATLAG